MALPAFVLERPKRTRRDLVERDYSPLVGAPRQDCSALRARPFERQRRFTAAAEPHSHFLHMPSSSKHPPPKVYANCYRTAEGVEPLARYGNNVCLLYTSPSPRD